MKKFTISDIYEETGRNLMGEQIREFKKGFTNEQLEQISDEEIESMSYAISYADFEGTERNWEIKRYLWDRHEKLKEQRKQKRLVSPIPKVECQNCGDMISRGLLMCSSTGSVCPDCYDDCSD